MKKGGKLNGTQPKRVRSVNFQIWVYKRNARNRGIAYRLSDRAAREMLLAPCTYCKAKSTPCGGLDRLDNRKGYTKRNTVPACWPCNRSKSTMPERDWILHVEAVIAAYYEGDYLGDVETDEPYSGSDRYVDVEDYWSLTEEY